jgi:hypothetical protein
MLLLALPDTCRPPHRHQDGPIQGQGRHRVVHAGDGGAGQACEPLALGC